MAKKKTISFAAVHFTVAFSVTYVITGSIALGGLIALVEPLINTVAFYIHERAWSIQEQRNTLTSAAV
ncbi:MAG: DUF2061 domain-containing protein [Granulosicoccus sp.]|nr:DUF2061 domain-containing protein [Granulosicoccus sp.]